MGSSYDDLSCLRRKNREFYVITVHGVDQSHGDREAASGDSKKAASLGGLALECYGEDRTINITYRLQSSYDALSSRIDEVAVDLLDRVKSKLHSIPSIVFIGQDLGGIIIKQALLIALRGGRYSPIIGKALALVFTETPHRVSDLESWDIIAAKLALRDLHVATCSFPNVVAALASRIMEINQSFQTVCSLFSVLNLYNITNSPDSLRFSREISIMDSQNEKIEEIEGNLHHMMNSTFQNKEKFMQLTEELMVRASETDTTRLKLITILSKLGLARPPTRAARLAVSKSEPCHWLFGTSEYHKWHERPNAALWLHGSLESELYALLSIIQRKLDKNSMDMSAVKFSFRKCDDNYRSVQSMMASLSHQLLMSNPRLYNRVETLCDRMGTKEAWKFDQVWTLFRSLLLSPELGRIVCFIHMIDQCDDITHQFLKEFSSISPRDGCSFKLVITSTNTSDLVIRSGIPMLINLDLRITIANADAENTGDRMRSFIERDMSLLIEANPEYQDFHDVIKNRLHNATDSLAVSIFLRLLQVHLTRSELEAEFRCIPFSLPEVFDYYLKKIPAARWEWSRLALSWIALAHRPLKLTELAVALAIGEANLTSLVALRRKISKDVESELHHTLGRLVVIYNREVTLIDDVFRDYLLKLTGANSLYDNATLAEACINLLELVVQEQRHHTMQEGDEHHLVTYAKKYWAKHYSLAQGHISFQLCERALTFLEEDWPILDNYQAINSNSAYGNILCYAVRFNCTDLVHSLLMKRSPGPAFMSVALEMAIENGIDEMVNLLVKFSADSPLKLHIAVLNRREKLITQFLSSDQNPISKSRAGNKVFQGQTPLHLAAAAGYHEIFISLLAAKFDFNAKDRRGITCLHLASQFGHPSILEELLSRGMEINVEDKLGDTPFLLACAWQQLDVVEKLLSHGHVQSTTGLYTDSALHIAVAVGCEDIVDAVLKNMQPEEINKAVMLQGKEGKTPLHLAAERGCSVVIERLLSEDLIALESLQDKDGNTPLHIAILNGNYGVVDQLLRLRKIITEPTTPETESFKSSIRIKDKRGRSPIHMAVGSGDLKVVQKICEEHVRINVSLNVGGDKSRQSPLHTAALYGLTDITDILLRSGAKVDICDKKSQTPFVLACRNGNIDTMELLLQKGAAPLHKYSLGRTALHDAIESRNMAMVKRLLEIPGVSAKDSISGRDLYGNTIFHSAAICGNMEIMKILLGFETSQDSLLDSLRNPNSSSKNILQVALEHNKLDMAHFLVDKIKVYIESSKGDNSVSKDCVSLATIRSFLEAIRPPSDAEKTGEASNAKSGFVKVREDLQELLRLRVDFDIWDTLECGPIGPILNLAVEKGVIEIVGRLVQLLRKRDEYFKDGITQALLLASRKGQTEIARLLLDSSDDEKQRRTNYHLAFQEVASIGNMGFLKYLISLHGSWLDYKTRISAFRNASNGGHVEVSEFLRKEILDAETIDGNGSTPLHEAAMAGDAALCRSLLEVRETYLNIKDYLGRTALHIAASRRDEVLVDLLLTVFHADVEAADHCGNTPIHEALYSPAVALGDGCETESTARLLLKNGANPLAIGKYTGTPVHVALNLSDISDEFIQEMLENISQSLDIKNHAGETPLFIAAREGRTKIIQILLAREDVNINQTNDKGCSPLKIAIMRGHIDIAKLFLGNSKLALDSVIPFESADTLLRDLVERNVPIQMLRFLLVENPEIINRFGTDELHRAAVMTDDPAIIHTALTLHPELAFREDEHGWSFLWLYYASQGHLAILPPEILGLHFQQPSRWQIKKSSCGISLQDDAALILSFSTPKGTSNLSLHREEPRIERNLILADHPIPPIGKFSFEIEILDGGENSNIGIGFGTRLAPDNEMPGWGSQSWGYHGEDGIIIHNDHEIASAEPYSQGDKIGCHIDQTKGSARFTKNGKYIGGEIEKFRGRLYPMVGMMSNGGKISTKFSKWDHDGK